MAAPTTIDLKYTRTNSALLLFSLEDAAGVAIDITGFSFTLTVNEEPDGSGAQIMSLTGTIDNGPAGDFSFAPTTIESTADPEKYRYDVKMTDLGPRDTTIISGVFELLANIS